LTGKTSPERRRRRAGVLAKPVPNEGPSPGGAPTLAREFSPVTAHDQAAEIPSSTLIGGARRRILEALTREERTIAELAQELGLHTTTLRYHLSFLVGHRLVEELEPEARNRGGRPPMRYRLARHASVPGFPVRHFEILAELAIRTVLEKTGESGLRYLGEQGEAAAQSMVDQLVADGRGGAWNAETFERLILGDLFTRFGVMSEIITREPHALTYRVFTCPFLELAERFPGIVCDTVDQGFHRGLDDVTRAETERLACMGHGDLYCEYRTAWPGGNRRRSRRPKGSSPRVTARWNGGDGGHGQG